MLSGEDVPALSAEPMTDETSVPLDGEAWAVVPRDPMRPEWVEMTRGALGRLFEDKRFAVFNVPVDLVSLNSLDAAWAEAVASLPPKWLGPCISPYYPKGWQVHAYHRDVVPTSARGPRSSGSFYGETLPDALHAFATRDR